MRRDVAEGGFTRGCGGELLDRGEHDGVFELGEWSVEDGGGERGAHLGAAEHLAVGGFVLGGRSGGEGVERDGAAWAQPDDGEPERLGERCVLAFGVDDGGPSAVAAGAVDGSLPPQQGFDEC